MAAGNSVPAICIVRGSSFCTVTIPKPRRSSHNRGPPNKGRCQLPASLATTDVDGAAANRQVHTYGVLLCECCVARTCRLVALLAFLIVASDLRITPSHHIILRARIFLLFCWYCRERT